MNVAKFEFSLFGINTYVVYDRITKDCAIIDPGMISEEEERAITGFIERNHLRVTHIIDTHLHIDHAVGVGFAKKKYNVPLFAHIEDSKMGMTLNEQAIRFHLSPEIENVSVDSFLEDGEEIGIGDGRLKVLHVPGHSKGSIALYDKDDNFVITGDALFAGSIGRTDLPGGNYGELLDSIKNKLLTLPEETVVYPGHGPATTIGTEKRYNPFLQ